MWSNDRSLTLAAPDTPRPMCCQPWLLDKYYAEGWQFNRLGLTKGQV